MSIHKTQLLLQSLPHPFTPTCLWASSPLVRNTILSGFTHLGVITSSTDVSSSWELEMSYVKDRDGGGNHDGGGRVDGASCQLSFSSLVQKFSACNTL